MTQPVPVKRVVAEYLRAVDAAVPGAVEGLYLGGSVAMGDFQAGRGMARLGPSGASVSDIDFVAVTSRPLATAAIRALHRVHRRLAAAPLRPVMDGIYLTWGDLAQDLVRFGGVRTATVVGSPPAAVVIRCGGRSWRSMASRSAVRTAVPCRSGSTGSDSSVAVGRRYAVGHRLVAPTAGGRRQAW